MPYSPAPHDYGFVEKSPEVFENLRAALNNRRKRACSFQGLIPANSSIEELAETENADLLTPALPLFQILDPKRELLQTGIFRSTGVTVDLIYGSKQPFRFNPQAWHSDRIPRSARSLSIASSEPTISLIGRYSFGPRGVIVPVADESTEVTGTPGHVYSLSERNIHRRPEDIKDEERMFVAVMLDSLGLLTAIKERTPYSRVRSFETL